MSTITIPEPRSHDPLVYSGDLRVSAFWWREVRNWGDELTPLLLKRFSHVDVTWAEPDKADIACVGSILGNLVKPTFTGVILGSGKLFENSLIPKKATILSLRGPLTARGVRGNYVLGDPALLADELVTVETKKHELGLVRHWSDTTSLAKVAPDGTVTIDPRFVKYNPVLINHYASALSVVRQIGECKKIISSSLHGLIIADAFGIPRRFEPGAKWNKEGGDFKVRDHNLAVGVEHKIGVTQQADWNRVADLKTCLFEAFETFQEMVAL